DLPAFADQLVDGGLELLSKPSVIKKLAVSGERLRAHVPCTDGDEIAIKSEAEVDAGSGVLVFARLPLPNGHIGSDVGLVRRFVLREARITLNAEEVRFDRRQVWVDVLEPLLKLVDQELQRLAAIVQKLCLVRLEPGAALLALELEEKLDRLIGKPTE